MDINGSLPPEFSNFTGDYLILVDLPLTGSLAPEFSSWTASDMYAMVDREEEMMIIFFNEWIVDEES